MAKSVSVPRRDRPVAAAPSQAPTPSGPAEFDPASHARFGHRYSQLAPAPAEESAPIQREAEEDGGDAEASVMSEGVAPSHPDVPVAAGGGSPIPPPVQDKMERSFGHSFADVRIHSGEEAKQVGALAYTRGTDIHFQPGRYDPASLGGQQLLGHELAHVVQQRSGRVSSPKQKPSGAAPINADGGLEAEADVQGAKAARGERAAVSGAGAGVQRKAEDAPIQRWPEWPTLSGTMSALGTVASGALSAVAHPINTAASVYGAVTHPIDTVTSAYNYMTGGGTPAPDPAAMHPPVLPSPDAHPLPPVVNNPAPVVAPPVKTAEEIAKEKEIDRLTGRNTASRATATRTPNADVTKPDVWAEAAADPAATYDYRSLKGTTDRGLAEKQYAAEVNNRATAAGPTRGALGSVERSGELVKEWDSVAGASKLTRSADIHGADGSVLKQADPDKPGKIDKARQDLLQSQLIADGRASATPFAPGTAAKGIKNSPVEALIKAGKDETSPEVIAVRAEKPYQDLLASTNLAKKSTVSGIDEAKHEAQAQHILEHMELGVNQNKLSDKMAAAGKTPAEIDTALMDMTDPLKPVAKNATGLETEIDAYNVGKGPADRVAPAHFVGRHGAQTTAEDQIMRLGAGVSPDKKPAAMPASVPKVGGAGVGAISLPDYTTTGTDTRATSASRFSSHGAELFAIEEAFAQASGATKELADHETLPYDVPTMKRETRQLAKYAPGAGGALLTTAPLAPVGDAALDQADRDAKAQRNPQHDWVEDKTIVPTPTTYGFDRDSTRTAVDVGPRLIGGKAYGSYTPKVGSPLNTGEGMGDAFNLAKPDPTKAQTHNPKLPDLTSGAALPTANLDKRLAAVEKTTGLDGAKVILDQDTKRGGFTPQTAFPTSLGGAMGSMTQDYTSTNNELKAKRTGGADQVGKVEVAAPIPSIVGSAGMVSDEDEFTKSAARIQAAQNFVWDDVAKAMVQTPYTK